MRDRTVFDWMVKLGPYRLRVSLARKRKRETVRDVLAARYATNAAHQPTQQNIPRDREFTLGTREAVPFEPLQPGPFEIVNEDEPLEAECSHCTHPLRGEPTHDLAGCVHHVACCYLCHRDREFTLGTRER